MTAAAAATPTCLEVIVGDGGLLDVVILHGYAMSPSDLAPFASALGLPGRYLLPLAPLPALPSGAAWWSIDQERRNTSRQRGARDLCDEDPEGLPEARRQLHAWLGTISGLAPPRRLVLGGFSQGAMLAMDYYLEYRPPVAGLVMLSSSRIAIADWTRKCRALDSLPLFLSHGRQDGDLAYTAGEALRDFARAAGARTTWLGFDGGHTTPLPVWRALRKFLTGLQ